MTVEGLIEITGTLAERPRAQMQPVGPGGDARPVLHMVLHDCGPFGMHVTATQPFPAGAIAQAHARAAQLQVGMQVRVQATWSRLHLHMPEVQHVFTTPSPTQEQANA